jgi:transcriptional regulator with XRE-family HTH domain
MKLTAQVSDEVFLEELGGRVARMRLSKNLTQAALAEQAGVSKRTLERLESGEVAVQLSGLVRVSRALGLAENWDALIPEIGPSPMAQLKRQGRRRQRASGSRGDETASAPAKWTWGEEAK